MDEVLLQLISQPYQLWGIFKGRKTNGRILTKTYFGTYPSFIEAFIRSKELSRWVEVEFKWVPSSKPDS